MTYCCDCYYYREDREGGGCYEPDRPVNKRAVGWLSPVCKMFKPKNQMKTEEAKICKKCGRELPLSHFSRNRYGLLSVCKTCCKEGRLASLKKKHGPADSAILRIPKTESQVDTRFFFGNVPDEELVAELRNRGYEVTCTKTITL